jgi:hypothetical protein
MMGLANSYCALSRHAEALKLREETLALRKAKLGPDHPDTLESMSALATSYAAVGQPADALRLCEEAAPTWEKLERADSLAPYYRANWRSQLAGLIRATDQSPEGAKRADALADQAMDWLRKAVALGYRNTAELKKEKAFDALRTREDFQKLLAELEVGLEKDKK